MADYIEFTDKEIKILKDVAIAVEEVYVEDRKGISQTKYVMRVDEGEYTDWNSDFGDEKPVPKKLIGTWMMAYGCDLRDECLSDCFEYHWVRCEQEEVTTFEWVAVEG